MTDRVGGDGSQNLRNGVFPRVVPEADIGTIWLNGSPAVRIDIPKFGTTVVSLAVENGRITRIYAMRNPSKLARLDEEAELTR